MLREMVDKKVKAIICLGVDNKKIKNSFKNSVKTIIETKSMFDAVKSAYSLGEAGDVILLSPACASYDLFQDFEDRGRQFKNIIREF